MKKKKVFNNIIISTRKRVRRSGIALKHYFIDNEYIFIHTYTQQNTYKIDLYKNGKLYHERINGIMLCQTSYMKKTKCFCYSLRIIFKYFEKKTK